MTDDATVHCTICGRPEIMPADIDAMTDAGADRTKARCRLTPRSPVAQAGRSRAPRGRGLKAQSLITKTSPPTRRERGDELPAPEPTNQTRQNVNTLINRTTSDGFAVQEPASASHIVGRLLKFKDGQYFIDKTELVPSGTLFVANNVVTGWIRWSDGKPAEFQITRAGDRHPEREELGHLDQEAWPLGLNKKPEDPWKDTRYLHLINQKSGADLTFVTDSFGGRRAIGDLKAQIANVRNAHAQALPIITLGSINWKTQYGEQPRPVFHVVDWIRRGGGQLALNKPDERPDWALDDGE
jgi:hypothetical protein